MTALAVDRKCDAYQFDDDQLLSRPVKGSTTLYGGGMVGIDTSGRAVPASATSSLKIRGVAAAQVVNSSATDGAKRVDIDCRPHYMNTPSSGANQILAANVDQLCYASDDNTVNLTDGAGLWPVAGVILDVRADGQVAVDFGKASAWDDIEVISGSLFARAVATSALAAYTATAGVITANANGALGSVFDGVTIVAGDTVFIPEGIAAAAADAGPYVVTSLGGASAKFVLTRPDWYAHGSLISQRDAIKIGPEGTLFKGTAWKSFVTTAIKVVGTDAPLMWPDKVLQSFALVAGTKTLTNVPIRSATLTKVTLNRTVANTSTATTGGYHPTTGGATGMTAGALGTGQVIIEATVAAGTINNADISTLTCEIVNW